MQDVIVIGGGHAGTAAALQPVRAHRSVLAIDAGRRRNRLASLSHGFPGQDGNDPARILGQRDAFHADSDSGERLASRRTLLACGLDDRLPDIPGIAERWGQWEFHCPHCHGYELDKGHIGGIATGPMSIHQAQLLADWGPVTVLTNGVITPDPGQMADLHRRGVAVEGTPIRQITGAVEVEWHNGRALALAGLFTATRTAPAQGLAQAAGCALMETPTGCQNQTADTRETSVPGIFACGDVARAPHSLSLAIADGAWAGAKLHRAPGWPEG